MNKKESTQTKWLKAAYIQFAYYGPEFSIKALAKKADLPRATLYYHFHTKEYLIDELLSSHLYLAEQYNNQLVRELNNIIPGLYEISINFELGIRFHQQLFKNRSEIKFNKVYNSINFSQAEILAPFIKSSFNFCGSDANVAALWNTLTDAWYSRITFDDFSVEKMCKLTESLVNIVLDVSTN